MPAAPPPGPTAVPASLPGPALLAVGSPPGPAPAAVLLPAVPPLLLPLSGPAPAAWLSRGALSAEGAGAGAPCVALDAAGVAHTRTQSTSCGWGSAGSVSRRGKTSCADCIKQQQQQAAGAPAAGGKPGCRRQPRTMVAGKGVLASGAPCQRPPTARLLRRGGRRGSASSSVSFLTARVRQQLPQLPGRAAPGQPSSSTASWGALPLPIPHGISDQGWSLNSHP